MNFMYADLMASELKMIENSVDDSFMESGIYDIVQDFSNGVKKIIGLMKEYIEKLKIDITMLVQKRQTRQKMERFKKSIELGNGPKIMEFPNIDAVVKLYESEIKTYKKWLKKIMNANCKTYQDVERLEKDINEFCEDMDIFEQQVEEKLSKPVKMRSADALNYIDDCLTGKFSIYDQFFSIAREFAQFENTASRKVTNKLLDSNAAVRVHKKVEGMFSKMANKLSKLLRRIITKVAFWLG